MIRFFLILLIFLIPQAYAFEDYIIVSELPVKYIGSADDTVVSIFPVPTIDNSKKNIIIKAKKEGKTFIIIETEKFERIDVEVTPDKTVLSPVDGLTYFSVDMPQKPEIRGYK